MLWCGEVGHIHRFCPHKKTTQNASPAKENEGDVGEFAAFVKLPGGTRWLVDSGASSHMTQERNILTDYKAFDTYQKVSLGDAWAPQKVSLGDCHVIHALGVGNVHLRMVFKVSQPKENVMYKVLYVPSLTCNLFSVRVTAEKGNTVNFGFDKCWIRDKWGAWFYLDSTPRGHREHENTKVRGPGVEATTPLYSNSSGGTTRSCD